ncbi:hypothetical protein SAMN00777080_1349 [Aquiflexum balticum DSM 16537]|uniref:Uncharacterized protein n=1 Tax=Aquiflexum balticum DSM 16537 TaxID=758820 RepID=A0A1W2H1Z8_9BACT|nr:DUF6090 family protein [Aquiflexum balticum]SMD42784.1 hypothetical protein SAMN00777080_1349 [Aquiflexum balticum DSM 16537]
MLNIFRKIRQKLLQEGLPAGQEGKVINYLKYATGEIFLVVIGILIALSINNWNEDNKNAKREHAFLTNLQQDLRSDSLRLKEIKERLKVAVSYKRVFESQMKGNVTDPDSLNAHFLMQYNLLIDFVPNSTTVDELSNNGLNLISSPSLRRQIVTLYNTYDDLILKLKIGQEKGQSVLNYVSQKVMNINSPTTDEIRHLLEDKFYVNQTYMNFLATQLKDADHALQQCKETLSMIQKDLAHD